MSWTTQIRDWTEWASAHLKEDDGDDPIPGYWRRDVPWFEDFLDLLGEEGPPKELHDAFETAVQNDNYPARFVGLDLYHRLAHQDAYPLQDELVEDARRIAADEYRWLVEAVPASDVPAQRRRIGWEVRLAARLRTWKRVDALLDRLREVDVDSRELDSIRAQQAFLRRYFSPENELDGAAVAEVIWTPLGVQSDASAEFAFLAMRALMITRPPEPDGPSPEEVFSLVERAHWPEVPSLQPLLLARPSFELGLHKTTIASLNAVLESPSAGRVKGLAYDALWEAHQRNGDAGATRALLQRWNAEFPDDSSVVMKLAKVAADDADYESAYRLLQRAASAQPELEQDLATRIGLALGEIATEKALTWNEVKAALARQPEAARVIEAVLKAYWSSFGELQEDERLEWLTAIYALEVVAGQAPTLAPSWLRQAGKAFLAVAEVVLRRAAFAPLRVDVAADLPLLQRLRAMRDSNDPNHILAKYLAASKGRITLGQMFRMFERAESRSFPEPFVALVSKHLATSPVLGQLDALRRLDQPRNDAVHELSYVDARSIHDDARRVIDAALRHASSLALLS